MISGNTAINIQVVPPVQADKSAWMDLWAQYNASYGRQGDKALSTDVIEKTWERILDPASSVKGLVAAINGTLVGLTHVVFHDNLIQLHQTCYMQDLYTSPDARGCGVARELINGVAEMCCQRGVSDIYWHTHVENTVARRLYDQVGEDTNFVVYRLRF